MGSERVTYEGIFDGLLNRTVGKRMTPALKAKLLALGVDIDHLKPTYAEPVWQSVVDLVCAEIFPTLPKDAALYQLGTEMVGGYGATIFGRALMKMIKLLGPRRTLERAGPNFRSGNNFTEVKLEAKGPTEYAMWMNVVGESGQFIRGALVGMLELAGAKDVKIDVVPDVAPAATFHIRWSA
jgi:uncharacterized protein (TIGR02265 family)